MQEPTFLINPNTRNRLQRFVQLQRPARLWSTWYKGSRWRRLRAAQLVKQPLCERCLAQGKVTAANVVNHRRPHKGDWSLFVDPANFESVCKEHHDALIQREEARGHLIGSDIHGRPVDPDHPWNSVLRQIARL